jgi:argininosuccinate lyase
MADETKRLWGGRFESAPTDEVLGFMAGRDVIAVPACDEMLVPYDIAGSIAHATMLAEVGIIPEESARRIVEGLEAIRRDREAGGFRLDPALEDVHTNVERELARRIGEDHAGHLHTARSRNDQVLLDMRLWERDAARCIAGEARHLAGVLLNLGREHRETLMPGFTHHQHATVTSLGHLLVGMVGGVIRTAERMADWLARFDRCPLGAVTGYGTTFPIDRRRVAELLGFPGVDEVSFDPVHTRGEAEAELVGALELGVLHVSSLAATLILLSTTEFGCITIADGFSTGSSIMPQKRNPDSLEVIKARAASVSGYSAGLRALPGRSIAGYNREQQWTKYMVMDAVREGEPCFGIMAAVLETMAVHREAMARLAGRGFIGATPLTEALCREHGLPFRAAKRIIERAVALSVESGSPDRVSSEALARALAEAEVDILPDAADVEQWQDPAAVLHQLTHAGSPGPDAVMEAASALEDRLSRCPS